jgi:hypothetical protein
MNHIQNFITGHIVTNKKIDPILLVSRGPSKWMSYRSQVQHVADSLKPKLGRPNFCHLSHTTISRALRYKEIIIQLFSYKRAKTIMIKTVLKLSTCATPSPSPFNNKKFPKLPKIHQPKLRKMVTAASTLQLTCRKIRHE